jgi:hypothetical protein
MSNDKNTENEHDLWRWYTQIYLHEIIEPPNGLSLIVEKLKESDLGNIMSNLKKIFMPEKINLEETTQVKQNGAGLFCQKDYTIDVYYKFRIVSYNDLITYLTKHQIKISLLTKQLLKKLYLYHYNLDYIKALNYILFKIKEHTLPVKLRSIISNLFEQIHNEIFNTLNK